MREVKGDVPVKKVCDICGELDEPFMCESCGRVVCGDCAINQKIADDDYFIECVECSEKD